MPSATGLSIHRLSPDDPSAAQRWDAYVRACPEATIFHLAGWQQVIREEFRHQTYFLYAASGDGRICGVLPLGLVASRLFGRSLSSLPFASYGGALGDSDEVVALLEDEGSRLARELRVDQLELRCQRRHRAERPCQELYVTFKRPIPAVLDEKMLCIPQKRRNMVRKALKLGLKPVFGDTVEHFFPVFSENARNHGTPTLPRRYFERLLRTFRDECEIVSINDAEGRCVSSILCFFFRGEVLAYYAGESLAARSTAANDLKYWSVMQRAAARGCTVFDLGRSKKGTGSFDFKRLWDFEAHQLYYEYDLITRDSIPQNNPTNKKYRFLIAAWKRLPLPVAELLGPPLVRSLG